MKYKLYTIKSCFEENRGINNAYRHPHILVIFGKIMP